MDDNDDRSVLLRTIQEGNADLREEVFREKPVDSVQKFATSIVELFDKDQILALPDLTPYFFPLVVSTFYDGEIVDNLFSLDYLTRILSGKFMTRHLIDWTTTRDFIFYNFDDLEKLPFENVKTKTEWYRTIGELCLLNLSLFTNAYYFRKQTREILGQEWYERRGIHAYRRAHLLETDPIKQAIYKAFSVNFPYFEEGFYTLADTTIFPGLKLDRLLFDMMPEHKKGQPIDPLKKENSKDYRRSLDE
ncbi:MAG: hypothetical protein GXP63_07120 [DPANN group archaeon]|nr:hypothetical protein [DPANN group archaeon]